jgi:hypothetical protein
MRRFLTAPRWSITALVLGASLAAALALVPSRADALERGFECGPTGNIVCYNISIGITEYGTWELRAYLPFWYPFGGYQ